MNGATLFLPLQSTIQVTINFPPTIGQIAVTPNTGVALTTQFQITVTGFADEDQPLTYSYLYYSNA
jgi:hypothetical protein